ALLGADGEVDAMCQVVAIVEGRLVVVMDVFRQHVLPFFGHDLQHHLTAKADVPSSLRLVSIASWVGYLAFQVHRSISGPSPSRMRGNSSTVKIPVFLRRAISPSV